MITRVYEQTKVNVEELIVACKFTMKYFPLMENAYDDII